jgi:PAS domain S-box-containing protein
VRELRQQFGGALLVIITAAAIFAAGVNFQQQKKYRLPQDGVTWTQQSGRVFALAVDLDGPAYRAGIRNGDRVTKINGQSIRKALDVTRILFALGDGAKAQYSVIQKNVPVEIPVIIGATKPDVFISYQYGVALIYLLLGLFVYFRRSAAPKALHFYLLCLVSFVQYAFHYTGKLNSFDKVMYWGNIAASILAPTIFFHFCAGFPQLPAWLRRRWFALYIPAASLLLVVWAVANGIVRMDLPEVELRWLLDRPLMVYWAAVYLAGAALLLFRFFGEHEPVLRRQLQWISMGVVLGVLPFTLIYVIPYALGWIPNDGMKAALVTLPLVPLTWGYAIVRHRLMEVDVVFQQGYVYTLATIAIIGALYGLFFSIGKFNDLGPTEVVALILVATFVFQPIRNFVEEQLGRNVFYRGAYDTRLTLIQFVRELGGNVELMPMLRAISERILRTLGVRQAVFFLWNEQRQAFEPALATEQNEDGQQSEFLIPADLDLGFLKPVPEKPYLFFESTRSFLDLGPRETAAQRRAIASLDLTYYLPCSARGRTIAYLGVSRTWKHDFLPSEDLELLTTLSGYAGIAIENSRLYESLQQKAEELERLKEYNENIVESINVGVLAAGLDGRVESWNSVMEQISGLTREQAVGRTLESVLPSSMQPHWDELSARDGIHNFYKISWPSPRGERTVNLAMAPLVTRDNDQIGRLLIVDDVTDRSELERRLVQADKLSSIGLLAAGVAHEVNTPLAVISTYAQMLGKQVNGDTQKAQILDKIAKQTFRASEIVNSLLNFSRTAPTEFIEVDVNRIVRETLTLVEPQLQAATIFVSLDLDPDLGPVKGNPSQLQQVLLNLILNARDAMAGGGSLRLTSSRRDSQAVLRVADTGHGIPADKLDRIFDPFFTTKGFGKGTGLGLAVSYGIIQEHAGTIDVESQEGQGTTFTLQFPLAPKPVHAGSVH